MRNYFRDDGGWGHGKLRVLPAGQDKKQACLLPRHPLRPLHIRKMFMILLLLQPETLAISIPSPWKPRFLPRNQRTRWSVQAVSRPIRRVVTTWRIDRVKWMIGATRKRSITRFHPMVRWRARNRKRTLHARKSDPTKPIWSVCLEAEAENPTLRLGVYLRRNITISVLFWKDPKGLEWFFTRKHIWSAVSVVLNQVLSTYIFIRTFVFAVRE